MFASSATASFNGSWYIFINLNPQYMKKPLNKAEEGSSL